MKQLAFAAGTLLVLGLVLATVIVAGQQKAAGFHPSGPSSYWPFDTSGDMTPNDVAHGNDATLMNGAAYQGGTDIPAISGNVDALVLDGTDDVVEVPDNALLDLASTDAISISLWINPTTDPDGDGVWHVLGKRIACDTSTGDINYQLVRDGTQLAFGSNMGGLGGGDLTLNTWSHVLVTYDGLGTLDFYVNGSLTGTSSSFTVGPTNNGTLKIGGSGVLGGGNCDTFPGKLDEVCMWRRALTTSEVAALAAGASCAPPATPTPTPCPDKDGDTICDSADDDKDGDGCPNANEKQTAAGSESSGGRRDQKNPWDYFNPTHDGVNRVDDILKVVQQYGKDDTDGNPGLPPYTAGYNPDTDRTYFGPNVWNLGPPDGQQRVNDILAQVYQYNHDCP